ncbi:MAG: PAS domain S-box protein [Syntrophothermus sp.]
MKNDTGPHEDWAKDIEKVKEFERLRAAEQEIGITELRESLSGTKYELSNLKFSLDEAAIIAVTDVKGTITYANKKFCELSKYTAEELIGQNHRIINSNYHPKEFFKEMYRTICSGRTWKGQIKNRAKDGSYYWVDTTIVPLRDTNGQLVKFLSIRFDITAQKLLEEKLRRDKERYEAIIEISEAFAAVTTVNDTTILQIARKLSEVLGGAIIIRLISEEDKSLKVLALYHKDEKIRRIMSEKLSGISFPMDKGIYGDVIKTGKSVLFTAAENTEIIKEADPALLDLFKKLNITSAVLVPLVVMSRVIGVVSLTHFVPGESYTEEDQIYLQNIARKIALGISNAELYKQNQTEIERRKKTEEELLDYKHRYSALFNNKTMCIVHCRIITNEQGEPVDFVTLQVNDAYESITGFKKEDVEGKRILELVPNIRSFPFDYIGNFGNVALNGGELNCEVLSQITKRWYSYYVYSPKRGEFTLIFLDVTERKELEISLSELKENLLEAQKLAKLGSYQIYVQSGKMLWTNELFHILGLEHLKEAPDLEKLKKMIHPDDLDKTVKKIQRIIENKVTEHDEYRIVLKDNSIKYIHTVCHPTVNDSGEVEMITGTVMDITERKLAELESRKTFEELKRSNKELEQFAYVASHDLQEPLRMVSNYVKLLSEKYGDKLDEKAKGFIHFAVDGASRMNRLIKDLLMFSRLTTQANPFEQVDLNLVLSEIFQDLKLLISERKVNIIFNQLPAVFADKVQMWQLFKNLILNGIKFNVSERPEIQIKAKRNGKQWLFSITDNGIGIEKEYFDRIFMIFQRLHEREKYPGTGIGLAICQKIVERHGGLIWVESETGKGSTFHFTLPYKSF